MRAATVHELRQHTLEAASWDRGSCPASQKELSTLIDAATLAALLDEQRNDATFCAHLALQAVPGAGAWLTAPPVDDGRELDPPLFQIALKRRLRVPVYEVDDFCPRCGSVKDKWGDHALTCSCNGERNIRHNSVRDILYEEALEASLRPEREKAGLLPARPTSDGAPERPLLNGRRPADVWLPRGASGRPEALDFAVSSGMRSDLFRLSAVDPGLAFVQYERYKRNYDNTEQSCSAAGFRFVPIIFEAHGGGWSPTARGLVDWVARQLAARTQEEPGSTSLRIAQRISCALQKENARAILARVGEPAAQQPVPADWDAVFREAA